MGGYGRWIRVHQLDRRILGIDCYVRAKKKAATQQNACYCIFLTHVMSDGDGMMKVLVGINLFWVYLTIMVVLFRSV